MEEESRNRLVENVKEWIQIDNQLKKIQKEARELRKNKKTLSLSLIEIMKSHEIDCLDIKEDKLIYSKNKVKKPLSKKHLMLSLLNFFKKDKQKAQEIQKYIMESREEVIKESIKRKL